MHRPCAQEHATGACYRSAIGFCAYHSLQDCHFKALSMGCSSMLLQKVLCRAVAKECPVRCVIMQAAERRRVLLKYVREVQPALVEQFVEDGPPAVVSAMKNTITNMLGTLPPQFFTVTISTVGENMSQLMLSVMMTGYLFRNAQYRMELRNALGGVSMRPAVSSSTTAVMQAAQSISASGVLQRSQSAPQQGSVLDEEAYAPGVQKSRVQVGTAAGSCKEHVTFQADEALSDRTCCPLRTARGKCFLWLAAHAHGVTMSGMLHMRTFRYAAAVQQCSIPDTLSGMLKAACQQHSPDRLAAAHLCPPLFCAPLAFLCLDPGPGYAWLSSLSSTQCVRFAHPHPDILKTHSAFCCCDATAAAGRCAAVAQGEWTGDPRGHTVH
jgi:hypothetical protein